MTILGVKQQLLDYFVKHDIFDQVKHGPSIVYDEETDDYHEQILSMALNELEEAGLIRKVEPTTWVLALPIELLSRSVMIPKDMGNEIAMVINHYNELDEIDIQCDPTKLDEDDIGRLLDIIHDLEEMLDEGDGPDEPGSEGLDTYDPKVN